MLWVDIVGEVVENDLLCWLVVMWCMLLGEGEELCVIYLVELYEGVVKLIVMYDGLVFGLEMDCGICGGWLVVLLSLKMLFEIG